MLLTRVPVSNHYDYKIIWKQPNKHLVDWKNILVLKLILDEIII